jgi:phage terminase large subunit GpA-like protein
VAIKGVPGWSAPAIGTPTQVDVTIGGRKIKGGASLWPVGGWSLKATFYANLNKDGMKAGELTDPPGYCHYHAECDEAFFKQQTAEFLKTAMFRGRPVRVWAVNGSAANHLLDCRVYAMAMADYCGAARMTEDQWSRLVALRAAPAELQQPDLLAVEPVQIAARPTLIGDESGGDQAEAPITFRRLF